MTLQDLIDVLIDVLLDEAYSQTPKDVAIARAVLLAYELGLEAGRKEALDELGLEAGRKEALGQLPRPEGRSL